jgi:uncharacterized repeat protein (TIGR01451 family)
MRKEIAMFRNKEIHSPTAKSILVLVAVAGLWFLGTWLLSHPQSNASYVQLTPAPFRSPIGDVELSLVKTVDNDAPQPGDVIEYTLAFSTTNEDSQAFNVHVYDFLPAGVIAIDPPAPNGMVALDVPTITTTNVITTVRVRVLEGYEKLYNHALMVADFLPATHASLLTTVDQPPLQLSLSKIGHTAVLTNSNLVYTIRCENTSDITVNDVTVTDILPSGLPLVGASPPPDEKSLPLLSWSLGDLAKNEDRVIVITTTAPAVAGVITNTAMADARQRVMTHTLFATQVITEGAILEVKKSGSAPKVDLGDELVYTLRYENIGNKLATGVVLTDTLPADITVIGAHPSASSSTSQQLVWHLDSLSPTISGKVVFTATVGGVGGRWLYNVADITGQPGSFPGYTELYTRVRLVILYLPLITRNYETQS